MCGPFRQLGWCLNGPGVVLICVYIDREGRLVGVKWKSLLGLWCLVEIMGIALSGGGTGLVYSPAVQSPLSDTVHTRCEDLPALPSRSFFSSSTSSFSSQMSMMLSVPLAIPKHQTHACYIDPTVFSQDLRTHVLQPFR